MRRLLRSPVLMALACVLALSACSDGTTSPEAGRERGGPAFLQGSALPNGYCYTEPPDQQPTCNASFTYSPYHFITVSDPGPITYQFSEAITEVSVYGGTTAGAFTCPGPYGTVTAKDASGTVVFTGDLTPNHPCSGPGSGTTDQVIVRLPRSLNIVTFVITEPTPIDSGDVFVYNIEFRNLCPPTTDTAHVADSREVWDSLFQGLNASNADSANTRLRRETGGLIRRRSDGSLYAIRIDDPLADGCSYTEQRGVIPPSSDQTIARWHTHPYFDGDTVFKSNCLPLKEAMGFAQPDANGGGSDPDWDRSLSDGYPGYVITKERVLSRVDPGVDSGQRASNPYRWQLPQNLALCSAVYVP